MNQVQFFIGADPEIFVGDAIKARSIIDKVGGTKEMPMPLPLGKGFAVQEDNVALEFNIPASDSREAFVNNISAAMEFLESMVNSLYDYKFVKSSAISFDAEELADPRSWVFGCEPDFNAWDGKKNPRPAATDPNLRSAGGHVHVGYKLNKEQKMELIRFMDLYLGVPSVLMDEGELRKQLYGKAGAYRDKSYGVEYRTLSNYWVFDKKLIEWVHRQTEKALDAVLKGLSIKEEQDLILSAINDNNKDAAAQLVAKYSLEVI